MTYFCPGMIVSDHSSVLLKNEVEENLSPHGGMRDL